MNYVSSILAPGALMNHAGLGVLPGIALVLLMVLLIRAVRGRRLPGLIVADLGVATFTVCQIPSIYFGIYRENAIIYGVGVATAASIYFIVRFGEGLDSFAFRLFTLVASLTGAAIAAMNIKLTLSQAVQWKGLQLSSVIPFRASFAIVGGGTKIDGLTLELMLFSFALLLLVHEKSRICQLIAVATSGVMCASLIMGMSKGVYLGVITLCFITIITARVSMLDLSRGVRVLLPVAALLVCAAAALFAISGLHLSGHHTVASVSEMRSVTGRYVIWKDSLLHIRRYLLVGVGGNNGILYTLQYRAASTEAPLTARTYNVLLEVLLQNGIVGLAAFGAIVVGTITSAKRQIVDSERTMTSRRALVVVTASICALIVSDLSNSAVIRHAPVMCLFMILAGVVNAEATKCGRNESWKSGAFSIVVGITVLVGIWFAGAGLSREYSEISYEVAATAMANSDWHAALRDIEVAERFSDCDALYTSMEGLLYAQMMSRGEGINEVFRRGGVLPPEEHRLAELSLDAYRRASRCAPMDAAFHNNMGWLCAQLGNEAQARRDVDRAIELEPNEALYHLSGGLLFEREGDEEMAYKEYAKAIAHSPGVLDSAFFVQLVDKHKEQIRGVVEQSRAIVSNFPRTPIETAAFARIAYQQGATSAADAALTEVLFELPNLTNAWVMRGRISERNGDMQNAALDFKRALFIDPLNRLALAKLASVDQIIGDNKNGLAAAQAAIMDEQSSEHAKRSYRMYHSESLSGNDLLPQGLAQYAEPTIDINQLCAATFTMAKREGVEVSSDVVAKMVLVNGGC